jgi:hypothetical protein
MSVSRLDLDKDFTFGRSLANYALKSNEIAQNVSTRLKMFKFDWFLDMQDGIDWVDILGNRANKDIILSEVERIVLATNGIAKLKNISIDSIDSNRGASISIDYNDIYGNEFKEQIGIL